MRRRGTILVDGDRSRAQKYSKVPEVFDHGPCGPATFDQLPFVPSQLPDRIGRECTYQVEYFWHRTVCLSSGLDTETQGNGCGRPSWKWPHMDSQVSGRGLEVAKTMGHVARDHRFLQGLASTLYPRITAIV
jgi:hypothetical protein